MSQHFHPLSQTRFDGYSFDSQSFGCQIYEQKGNTPFLPCQGLTFPLLYLQSLHMSNSRFAIALHTLALLACSDGTKSSTAIAASVNTNPVTIRKVLGSLNCAGLTETVMGSDGGARLTRTPSEISLLDIYRATEQRPLFEHHPKPPNQDCDCGRKITPVLSCVFHDAEDALCDVLATKTLADVLLEMEVVAV